MRYICPLIVISDIERSRQFYENLLGQKVKYDFGENVQFEGDFSIHLEEHYKKLLGQGHQEVKKKANNFELYFETDRIEQLICMLKENRIEIIHEIVEQPWGQRVTRFYDPDYHIIEVGETLESVVLRYHYNGMNIEEIIEKTSMPKEFIEKTIFKTIS
jgi:catechol 2,3-dioxygenase-like lactoylglutathione lyase family enzyme